MAFSAWLACGAAAAASDTLSDSEVFWVDAEHAGLLTRLAGGDNAPTAAVVLVHDALGRDARADQYVAQLAAAGIAVLEVELRAISLDGTTPDAGPEDAKEGAARATAAAAALARGARVDPARIGAIGFGAGAWAVLLAPRTADGYDPFAARALLYPGCGALGQALAMSMDGPLALLAAPRERAAPKARRLLLHGDADPFNLPVDCANLAAAVAEAHLVRRVTYAGAGYGWDTLALGSSAWTTRLPAPGVPGGRARAAPWPELATLSAARVAAFLAEALASERRP
ncbi:dienelactone hydrolase family protein [Falsiroseomonas sp. E2-1-a20]